MKCALLLLCGFIAAPVAAQDGNQLARAALDYQMHCAACHGISGKGDGPVAPALLTPPSDLTTLAARNEGVFPDASVAFIIDGRGDVLAHGTRDMPVWGEYFSHDDLGHETPAMARARIEALTQYLKTLQR